MLFFFRTVIQWRRFILLSGFAGAVILALIYGVPSSHAFKVVFAVLPLMVSGAVAVHRVLRDSAADRLPRSASAVYVVALSLAVGVGSLRYQSQCNYCGAPLVCLTQDFSHPLLSGLRGERKRVSSVEHALSYLSTRVHRGDFLLAYDNVALLYYLTQTRPAIDHCATAKVVPVDLRRRAVQKMIDGRRVPGYAVRYVPGGPWFVYSTKDTVDPVHAFVARHYDLEVTFPPFEIWRRRRSDTQPRE